MRVIRWAFNWATDGNHYLHGIPVYPITGQVLFSVQDQEAKLKQFWTVDGKEVTLGQKPFTAYLIESEVGFQQRQERIEIEIKKLNNPKYEKAIGPMIAIVNFDMQKQEIRFYQVTKERKLIPSGSFNGSVQVPSTSYFWPDIIRYQLRFIRNLKLAGKATSFTYTSRLVNPNE